MGTMFWGDRFLSRVISMARTTGLRPTFIDLGFSWLASYGDYLHEGSDRKIKARPQWNLFPNMENSGLVILEDVILLCDIYLQSGDIRVLYEDDANMAHFHTCVSCQLQEVDWWLGNNQALAACVTSDMIKHLPIVGDGEGAGSWANGSRLILFNARRVVRAMLVFRAVLVAVLLTMGLDNSQFEDSSVELGKRIVFLR